jgi:hypothetical protein
MAFKAIFVFKGSDYYLFNLHLVPTDKNPALEAAHLASLGETYKGKKIIFMGDLNLSQSDPGFNGVKKWAKPTLIGKKTSLKMKEGDIDSSIRYNHADKHVLPRKRITVPGAHLLPYPNAAQLFQ